MALKTIMECDICGKPKNGKYLIAEITRREHNPDVTKLAKDYCGETDCAIIVPAYASKLLMSEFVYVCEECEAKIKALCESIKAGEPEPTKVYNCFTCKKGVDMEWHDECEECARTFRRNSTPPSHWEPKE